MGVSIKNVYTCPRCQESITTDKKPDKCGGCGFRFRHEEPSGFMTPVTLSEQCGNNDNDPAYLKFVLSLPVETAQNILSDAFDIIRTIAVKKVENSDIRLIVGLAIRIGEVAKAYDDFLRAGGSHTLGLFVTTLKETQNEQQPKPRRTASSILSPSVQLPLDGSAETQAPPKSE